MDKNYHEVSPPGWSGTVKAMKKHKEIDNPYALAWHMKNKGDEAHYEPEPDDSSKSSKEPKKKKKYKDEDKKKFKEWLDIRDPEFLNESKWIQKAIKHPGRCTPAPNPDCPVGSPQYNLAQRFKKGDLHKKD
jgi:hypothetical protein